MFSRRERKPFAYAQRQIVLDSPCSETHVKSSVGAKSCPCQHCLCTSDCHLFTFITLVCPIYETFDMPQQQENLYFRCKNLLSYFQFEIICSCRQGGMCELPILHHVFWGMPGRNWCKSAKSNMHHCLHERLLLIMWNCTCDPRFVYLQYRVSCC